MPQVIVRITLNDYGYHIRSGIETDHAHSLSAAIHKAEVIQARLGSQEAVIEIEESLVEFLPKEFRVL